MRREGAAYKLKPQMQGKLKNCHKYIEDFVADEVRRPKTSLELSHETLLTSMQRNVKYLQSTHWPMGARRMGSIEHAEILA